MTADLRLAGIDRALVILADGARPDVMERLARAGELPWTKKLFVDRGGFASASSVFPTVSGPAHLPVLTGVHPGRANLPGIRWAERPKGKRGSFLFRTRSYMAPFRARKLARDVPAGVQTLFHHMPGLADVNTWFVRGCPGRARFTRFSKAAAFVRSLTTKDWYASDLQAERSVRRAWDRGFPSAFAVFPAIDELGHRFGPGTNDSDEAYRRFDAALGRLADDLTARGQLERTLIMVTSDHGQTDTHTHVDIDDLVAEVYPKTLAYPKLWRHLFSAEAAAMVSGNGMANIYLQGENGWHEAPDLEAPGRRPAELLARLLAHPAIGMTIHRRAPGVFVISDARGKLVIDGRDVAAAGGPADAARAGVTVGLSVEGGDPLALGRPYPARATRAELLALTQASAFPDAPWQVIEFYASPRAGDLVVCARNGFDLRSRFEYQPHRGSHGCLDREHMMIPAAVNARWAGDDPITAVDLFPTLLGALGLPVPPGLSGQARPLATV